MGTYSDFAKRISKFRDDLEDQHTSKTTSSMGEMQVSVQNELRRGDSVARGVLVGDVQHTPSQDTSADTVVSRSVNVPGFGKYLEHGTGIMGRQDTLPDHRQYDAPDPLPPLDPILTWVIAKNLTSDEYDSKTALAQAIASSIGAHGTMPHPFLRPVWYGNNGYRNVIRANKQAQRTALRRL